MALHLPQLCLGSDSPEGSVRELKRDKKKKTVKRGVNEREQDVYLARRCVRCLHLLGSSHAQGGFAGIKGSVQVEPSFIHGLLPPNAAAPLRSLP